jgi:hypothetical protein
MADIFDEVNEDLKRDQMQVLWARYGKIVMIIIAMVVLGVALRQGYVAWRAQQLESSAASYYEAIRDDDVITALQTEIASLTDGYAMLSQFKIASEYAARKDFAAAETAYLSLASNQSFEPIYQQAALLLSVMVAPDDVEVESLIDRLVSLENSAGPWQAIALEASAGLMMRAGDKVAAASKFKKISALAGIPIGIRQRAERINAMLVDE